MSETHRALEAALRLGMDYSLKLQRRNPDLFYVREMATGCLLARVTRTKLPWARRLPTPAQTTWTITGLGLLATHEQHEWHYGGPSPSATTRSQPNIVSRVRLDAAIGVVERWITWLRQEMEDREKLST